MKRLLFILAVTCLSFAQTKIDLTRQVKNVLPAADMPALTGECTTSSGAVAVTCGTGIAHTGTDINTSYQITATHLAAGLPVNQGGTALTSGTSGGILGYTGSGTLASSVALTLHALTIGGGAGATPTPLASLGTSTTLLHGAAAGDPTFSAVVEADQTLADNTTNNASASKHGYVPKLSGSNSDCLHGDGTYSACNSVAATNNSALFTQVADATVVSSTAETSIIGSGVGSKTTAANYFAAGTSLEIAMGGYFQSAAVDTLNIKIKAGSVIVGSTGAAAYGVLAANQGFRLYALVTCRTAGASGTFQVDTIFETTGTALTPQESKIINTSDVVLDTTGTLAWDVTATWSANSASDTITGKTFAMWTPGTGIADPGGNGILSRTAANTVSALSMAATSPITITNANGTAGNPTYACATCVVASSPGVGLAHFAGSTQTVTSSAVDLSGADATGVMAAGRMPALTGDVTNSAGSLTTVLGNIPNAVTMAGDVVTTNSAAPSSPASGKDALFTDSTDLRFHDKNASGVIGTTVVADTGASNNFLTAISAAGAVSKAQPAFTNLSGSATAAQLPANVKVRDFGTTFGDTTGSAQTSGSVVYFTVPYACTISAWNMSVDAGTATIDIWKIATGTAIPTVTNTITASALPAIASGTSIHSTTLTGWTTSVTANDIFGFQLKTVATAKFIEIDVECDQ